MLSIYHMLCFLATGSSIAANPVSSNGHPIEVAGLHMLLNDEVFAKEIVPMVRPAQYMRCKVL